MRRPSLNLAMAMGGGGAPYDPRFDSTVIRWWDPATLTPGLVSTWTDRIASKSLAAAGGARPTASATAQNGRPGVTFSGSNLLTVAEDYSARSAIRVLIGVQQTTPGVSIILEHTANAVTTNGGFAVGTNFDGGATISCAARGASGSGRSASPATYYLPTTPRVVLVGLDATRGDGTEFLQLDRYRPTLTHASSNNGSGSFANSTLNVGARSGLTLGFVGVITDIMLVSATATAADLDRQRDFILGRMGFTREVGRIHVLADSIGLGRIPSTFGTGGYRKVLSAGLEASGQHYLFVGSVNAESTGLRMPYHTAVAGETAQVALGYAATVVDANDPDILLIAYGMNDIGLGRSTAAYVADVQALTLACLAVQPTARPLIVGPYDPTSAYPTYYANIANYAPARAALAAMAAGHNWAYMSYPQPLALIDGVHPSDGPGGYDLIATSVGPALFAA